MNRIFNTTFEASVRILMLLSLVLEPIEAERIVALDSITIYGHSIGFAEYDINSNSQRRSNEYTARRYKDLNAIKRLTLTGLIKAEFINSALMYSITTTGKNYVQSLTSEYSKHYKTNAQQIISKINDFSTAELIKLARDTGDIAK
jgi:hypothetical protein